MRSNTKPNSSFPMLAAGRTSGGVLLPTLTILAVVVALGALAFSFTGNVGRFADRNVTRQQALAVADAALELQFAQWCAILQYGITFAPPTSAFDKLSLPSASMFPGVNDFTATSGTTGNYVVSNYRIQAVDPLEQPVPTGEKPTMISTNSTAINLYHYLGTVDVTLPSRSGPVNIKLGRIFQLQNRSPWSYAIFFDRDLEINPGPKMSITGDVHTNGNVYLGAGGGEITFSSVVEASGQNIVRGESPLDPSDRTNPLSSINYPTGQPRSSVESQTPLGISHSALNTDDSNHNNDTYHEVIEPPVTPLSTNSDPFTPPEKQTLRYYNMADYKISVWNDSADLTQPANITVLDANDQTVSTTSNLYKVLTAGATIGGKTYAPVLTVSGTLQDNREAATMKLTTVNVGALKAAVDGGVIPAKTAGLLFYINDTRPMKPYTAHVDAIPGTPAVPAVPAVPTTYKPNGQVRKQGTPAIPEIPAVPGVPEVVGNPKMEAALFIDNGNILPDNGLTIVSGNPLYVQGDYNTGETKPANLPSNQTEGGSPTKGDYWQPAALIGDAITVLSNAWTTNSTSTTDATATTINAAIMAGNVPSDGVNYSGGAENFPRFLEDWTKGQSKDENKARFTYYGSLVCLFTSQQAKEPWGKDNVYTAPRRYWNFDKRFYTTTPPGTFMVPAYQKLRWFVR